MALVLSRRQALGAALATGLVGSGRSRASTAPPRGLVLPRQAVPSWPLTDADGGVTTLRARLLGKVSAVQLMFAGCATSCPIQGAVFAAAARNLRAADAQLISLTVDPLGDSPQALRAWLERFGRTPRWRAAVPRVQDVGALGEFLRGAPPNAGTHTSQVYLFDRQGQLAFRTVEQPTAEHVGELLEQLARA